MPYVTTEYLTKFELTRILGLRQLQLEQANASGEPPRRVALSEVLDGRNLMVIRRRLPDGTTEDRVVSTLKISEHLRRLCTDELTQECRR